MKHIHLIESILTREPKGVWVDRHNNAVAASRPDHEEHGLLLMLRGLAAYADAYQARYESPIGKDYVIGEAWENSLRAFRTLLNGELGRLDGRTLDKAACELYRACGFEEEL